MMSLKLRLAIAGAVVIALSVGITVVHSVAEVEHRAEASTIDSNLGAAQLAATLSANIIDRQRALNTAARDWSRGQPANASSIQAFLARHAVLRSLFNDVIVVPNDRLSGTPAEPVLAPAVKGITPTDSVLLTVPVPAAEARPPLLAGALQLQGTNFLSVIARAAGLDAANLKTIVANRRGFVLAHADRQRLMTTVDDDPALRDAVARWRRQGSPLEPTPWTGRFGEQFVAMAAVPGTDWMVFRVATVEALSGEASRSTARTIVLGVSVGLTGALAIFGITAWFLRPMTMLRRRALRALDVDQAPSEGWPEASGEVGDLSRVLKDVSVRLAASRLDIEQTLQRMQAVLTHAPVGIVFTREGRFELVSNEIERMFGYAKGELDGASHEPLLPPDPLRTVLRKKTESAIRDGHAFEGEVPLRCRDGSTLWCHVRGAEMQGMQQLRIWIISDATAARRQREALLWSATRDPLTELVNRREFEKQLSQTVAGRRRRDPACALFIDLDHFKQVNDGAGHIAGDAVLKRIAQVLRQQLRAEDTVGRLGGDEFAILLRGCKLAQALQIAEQVRAQIELHGVCDAHPPVRVTASIGIVEIGPMHSTLAEVLEAADRACYAAKHAGRNTVRAEIPTPQPI